MAYIQKKAGKYNNVRAEYDGRWYHSKGEAGYAQELDWLKKAGKIQDWIPQYKIELKVNGVHITNYYVDFKVIDANGGVEFHEYKGMSTPEFKCKWNLLHALKDEIEPGCTLVLIKHNSTFKPKKK